MSDNWNGGYKTPPIDKRFKPGQSGNPDGRQKTVKKDPLDIIVGVLLEPISLNINGRRYRAPSIQFVARGVVHKAARGDSRAVKLATELTNLAYALDSKNNPNGQMEVKHVDENGKLQPGRPTRPRRSK